ncbi:hypothetical protein Tco_0004100 [Tanacetum coccineum]
MGVGDMGIASGWQEVVSTSGVGRLGCALRVAGVTTGWWGDVQEVVGRGWAEWTWGAWWGLLMLGFECLGCGVKYWHGDWAVEVGGVGDGLGVRCWGGGRALVLGCYVVGGVRDRGLWWVREEGGWEFRLGEGVGGWGLGVLGGSCVGRGVTCDGGWCGDGVVGSASGGGGRGVWVGKKFGYEERSCLWGDGGSMVGGGGGRCFGFMVSGVGRDGGGGGGWSRMCGACLKVVYGKLGSWVGGVLGGIGCGWSVLCSVRWWGWGVIVNEVWNVVGVVWGCCYVVGGVMVGAGGWWEVLLSWRWLVDWECRVGGEYCGLGDRLGGISSNVIRPDDVEIGVGGGLRRRCVVSSTKAFGGWGGEGSARGVLMVSDGGGRGLALWGWGELRVGLLLAVVGLSGRGGVLMRVVSSCERWLAIGVLNGVDDVVRGSLGSGEMLLGLVGRADGGVWVGWSVWGDTLWLGLVWNRRRRAVRLWVCLGGFVEGVGLGIGSKLFGVLGGLCSGRLWTEVENEPGVNGGAMECVLRLVDVGLWEMCWGACGGRAGAEGGVGWDFVAWGVVSLCGGLFSWCSEFAWFRVGWGSIGYGVD